MEENTNKIEIIAIISLCFLLPLAVGAGSYKFEHLSPTFKTQSAMMESLGGNGHLNVGPIGGGRLPHITMDRHLGNLLCSGL